MSRAIYAVSACMLVPLLLTAGGCQEQSNSSLLRQAKLIADENLQLKKELEACQADTQDQRRRADQAVEKAEQAKRQAGDNNIKLLGALAKESTKVKELTAEVQRLQAQIKELEAQ